MNRRLKPVVAAIAAVAASVLAGCGESRTIRLAYSRPAETDIPADVARLAVAEFGTTNPQDRRWGQAASDMLAASLDEQNARHKRYELYTRTRIKEILAERELQDSGIVEADQARRIGKLCGVDAIIFGNVNVIARDQVSRKEVTDWSPGRHIRKTRVVAYTRRYCVAVVSISMIDVRTGGSIRTVTLTEEYDSDKDPACQGSGDSPPPSDKIIIGLIERCVLRFVNMISPHDEAVVEKLARCKGKLNNAANTLAAGGDYDGALRIYLQMHQSDRHDHGAAFNAGLMYEAKKDFANARLWYDRAFRIKQDDRYLLARRRAEREGGL